MIVPHTMAALTLLIAAMILLRLFWMRLPPVLRWLLPRGALVMILLQVAFTVTKWGTTSAYVNVIINWLAIAGYVLLVLLFSRLSPRWLTSLSAAILIIPLFASTILLPLAGIFRPGSLKKTAVGRNLYYKIVPWVNNGAGNSGVDLEIYYRPVFAPFLSHKVNSQSFNTMECDAANAYVVPAPDPRMVIAHCPHWSNQPTGTQDKLVYLSIR